MVKAVGPDSNGQYRVQGYPVGYVVGLFFGILLLIFGIASMLVNPIAGAIVLLIANILIFGSNRYAKGVKQKVINRYAAQLEQQKSDINYDAL